MPPREPSWWYCRKTGWPSRLLEPTAALYGWIAKRRFAHTTPYRSSLPVICVGNFTAGGTGKTPLSVHIAKTLIGGGGSPVVLTRGYRGKLSGPVLVDPARSVATDVGDEPLLLAEITRTLVARDRRAGAKAIEELSPPATAIIMDDGLQNPALRKDLVIAVVDAGRGFGNGRVIPAGPLRAPLAFQLGLADAIVINAGPKTAAEPSVGQWLRQHFHGPVLQVETEAIATPEILNGPVVAFAGIANPERFRQSLMSVGAQILSFFPVADHHGFTDAECERLLTVARGAQATLVTTEKDWVRLGQNGVQGQLRAACQVLRIRLKIDARDETRLGALLAAALAKPN